MNCVKRGGGEAPSTSAADSSYLMEVAHGVEQRQFDAAHLGKSPDFLSPRVGLIDLGESLRWGTAKLVFRTKDQKESVSGIRQPVLFDQAVHYK